MSRIFVKSEKRARHGLSFSFAHEVRIRQETELIAACTSPMHTAPRGLFSRRDLTKTSSTNTTVLVALAFHHYGTPYIFGEPVRGIRQAVFEMTSETFSPSALFFSLSLSRPIMTAFRISNQYYANVARDFFRLHGNLCHVNVIF